MKKKIYIISALVLLLGSATFAQTGNVGIGTTTPHSKLTVNGNASFGSGYLGTAAPVDGAIIQGNVGIGTPAPGVKLDVAQPIGTSEATQLRILNTSPAAANNTAYIGFNSYNGGGANWGIGSIQNSATDDDSKFHIMYSGGANYLKFFTLVSSAPGSSGAPGRLGVNNTSPSYALDVSSATATGEVPIARVVNSSTLVAGNKAIIGFNAYNGGGATWGIGSEQNNTNPYDSKFHLFYSLGGPYLRYMTVLPFTGFVGIGNVTPAYKLDVAGDINASGTVRAAGVALTSDARLKRNVNNTTYGLKAVMALRPVEYEKKNNLKDADYTRHEIGFIAQEVAKVIPSLVAAGADADKTLSVSYTELIPILTKAIQEQQQQIETLKLRNTELKAQVERINHVEEQLTSLKSIVEQLNGTSNTATVLSK